MAVDISIDDLTNGLLDANNEWVGTGVFDKLIAAVNKNIEGQYELGRIDANDFANVYLGGLQSVVAQSMQYILQEKQIEAQTDLLITQKTEAALNGAKDRALKDAQIEKMQADAEIAKAQAKREYVLTVANVDKVYGYGYTLDANGEIDLSSLVDSGTGKMDYENRLSEKQVTKIDKDIELETSKITESQFNVNNLLPKELEVKTAQIAGMTKDNELKDAQIVKMESDALISKTQSERESAKTLADISKIYGYSYEQNADGSIVLTSLESTGTGRMDYENTLSSKQVEKIDKDIEISTVKVAEMQLNVNSIMPKEIEVKDAQIAGMVKDNEIKDIQVLNITKDLTVKDAQITSIEKDNDLKTQQITESQFNIDNMLPKELEVKTTQIIGMLKDNELKESQILSATKELAVKDAQIEGMNKDVEVKTKEIEQITSQVDMTTAQKTELVANGVVDRELKTKQASHTEAQTQLAVDQDQELLLNGVKDRLLKDKQVEELTVKTGLLEVQTTDVLKGIDIKTLNSLLGPWSSLYSNSKITTNVEGVTNNGTIDYLITKLVQ